MERKVLRLTQSKGKPAQVGYDLSVKEIKRVLNISHGYILKDSTILRPYSEKIEVEKIEVEIKGKPLEVTGWFLNVGYYEVTFWEGCDIPNNLAGRIRQRSSLLRNAAQLHSSIFDPGFSTDFMGSFINIFEPIFIEQDARIGQIYFNECEPLGADKIYNGQWQNDKQRK